MAKSKRSFEVKILGDNCTPYNGECKALTVPTEKDYITVLPHHTPIIAKLGKGVMTLRIDGGISRQDIDGGLLYVGDDEVVVLVNL